MNLILRPVSLNDIDLLYDWENREESLAVNTENKGYSKLEIRMLILSSMSADINGFGQNKQVRFMIVCDGETVGTIDLTDYDDGAKSAFVGVLIAEEKHRKKGLASRALMALEQKALGLNVHILTCYIQDHNQASLALFRKVGFEQKTNLLKDSKLLYLEKCLRK